MEHSDHDDELVMSEVQIEAAEKLRVSMVCSKSAPSFVPDSDSIPDSDPVCVKSCESVPDTVPDFDCARDSAVDSDSAPESDPESDCAADSVDELPSALALVSGSTHSNAETRDNKVRTV